jgi:transposase
VSRRLNRRCGRLKWVGTLGHRAPWISRRTLPKHGRPNLLRTPARARLPGRDDAAEPVTLERPTGRTTLTATSAVAHSKKPKPRP